MIRNSLRITTCALTAVLAFSAFGMRAEAASILPSGGVGLTIGTGTKLETIATEVKKADVQIENIVKTVDKSLLETVAVAAQEPTEEDTFRNLVIAQVNDYINIRSLPGEDGEVLGKLYDDSVGTYISEENGWYQIKSGSVTGFVKAEYCVTGEEAVELAKEVGTRIATVTTTTLKVRTQPSLEASVMGLVPIEDQLVVGEEQEGWVQVDIEEGMGWVSAEYVELHTEFREAESKEEEKARLEKEAEERRRANAAAAASQKKKSKTTTTYVATGDSEMGKEVANYALQFVGNPYVYGGTSLTKGADCSGFVMKVYENFGVSLPHSSAADRKQGYAVDGIENAQPGDLVCYSGHVALYIGDGQIVHASSSKTGIIVSNVNYKKVLAVRRIF
ncbi:MAG: hypothetical protein E7286_00730 [Lachnospiraceae bacterium]|nr:hypothetical protein [Lachnospiraceae bacterium]